MSAPRLRVGHLLALAKDPDRRPLEAALGRPVVVLPSGMPRWPPLPVAPPARGPDDRRVLAADPPVARPGSPAAQRLALLRPGATVAQFLKHGGTRRDLRAGLRAGWLRLED